MVKKTRELNLKMDDYLNEKLGEVKKLSEVSSEIAYQIPTHLSHKFKEFFNDFDRNLNELGISSYGISVTTLEEVFLRVGHPDKVDDKVELLKNEDRAHTMEVLVA